MSARLVEVFGASAARHRDHVHVLVQTAEGPATLVFRDALAKVVAREIGLAAIPCTGERTVFPHPHAPTAKPNGRLL